ncbi:MAG: FAD-binding domain-containing protein, partial [Candidatus Tisiphia sp.]
MIVASFFSKNLLLDWRKGEEFFAQYLIDYELS